MTVPKILKILNKGLIAGVVVSTFSFTLPLVPCTKSLDSISKYRPTICKFSNPFTEQTIGISQKFYGISTEPLAGLILQFLVILLISSIIFSVLRRKPTKVLDLTKKKQ